MSILTWWRGGEAWRRRGGASLLGGWWREKGLVGNGVVDSSAVHREVGLETGVGGLAMLLDDEDPTEYLIKMAKRTSLFCPGA